MKQQKKILRGEAALILAVIINSLGVLLMLQSGSGISAISSVPYAFQQVFPETDTRHLDLPVSGTFDLHSNDYAKKICPILFI